MGSASTRRTATRWGRGRPWLLGALLVAATAALAAAFSVSPGSRSRQASLVRPKHQAARPTAATRAPWPSALTTGAHRRLVTRSLPVSGGFFSSDEPNLTIANAEIDGGVYWSGSGTLTLRNDIIKPDWAQAWAAVAVAGGGNVTIDHVTITGVNVGAPGKFTKGIIMQSGGSLNVSYLDESGICQNDVGSGPTVIRDSYLHEIGSGNGGTCHATGVEIQGPTEGPIAIIHNTIDEFPGREFRAGSDGAIFVQALNGPISGIVIRDNFLHSGYSDIEIASDGGYPIVVPAVTNNCLLWPKGGTPVSAPGTRLTLWSGNTRCNLAGQDTGRAVRAR